MSKSNYAFVYPISQWPICNFTLLFRMLCNWALVALRCSLMALGVWPLSMNLFSCFLNFVITYWSHIFDYCTCLGFCLVLALAFIPNVCLFNAIIF